MEDELHELEKEVLTGDYEREERNYPCKETVQTALDAGADVDDLTY